jgi:hypothetical protein
MFLRLNQRLIPHFVRNYKINFTSRNAFSPSRRK